MRSHPAPATTTRPDPGDGPPATGWSIVLPVKGGPDAKSRLVDPRRRDLARAFALDAVSAVLTCDDVALVVVVTGDPTVAAEHAAMGVTVVTDPGGGLEAALLAGAAATPGSHPCGLLLADLPALRPDDLALTLRACRQLLDDGAAQVTVPDAEGSGTVLLAAATPSGLRPRFGPGSARAHAQDAVVLREVPEGVRRDVDTDAHLVRAVALGVGPRTAVLVGGSGSAGGGGPCGDSPQPRSTIAPSEASLSPKRS